MDELLLGEKPEKWEIMPLKSLFNYSKGLSITKADLVESGVAVLSYGQIHAKDNPKTCISDELIRYVSPQMANPNSLGQIDGFIFADTSEDLEGCGNCNYIDKNNIYAGYHTVLLNPKKEKLMEYRYLAYLFQTDLWRHQIRKELTEVKVFSVSQGVLKSAWIFAPTYSEQKNIVEYLDKKCVAISNAINKQKKIIEKLELYRTQMISYTVLHGINRNVRETKNDTIGSYPSHWKISRLKFSAKVVRGGSPRPIDNYITEEEGLNWIKIGDATGNGKYINETKQKIKKEGLNKTRLVQPGTLLLTNSMSFGHPYVLNITGCIHDGWLAFSDYEGIEQDYLYYFLISDSAMNQFVRTVEGSVVNNLNIEKVRNALITIPPIKEQREIIDFLEKKNNEIDNAIKTKEKIVSKLEEYKKTLIHNAVTGKINCQNYTVTEG